MLYFFLFVSLISKKLCLSCGITSAHLSSLPLPFPPSFLPHPVSPHPLSSCKAKFILRSLQTPDNGEVSCQSCCRLAAWSPVSWAPGLSSDLQNEAHWLIWARLSESTGCYKSQLRARLPDKTGTTWHCSGRGVWH